MRVVYIYDKRRTTHRLSVEKACMVERLRLFTKDKNTVLFNTIMLLSHFKG